MVTIEQLNEFNKKEGRDESLYLLEFQFYRKGINGNYIEKNNDDFFGEYDELEEAMDEFKTLCRLHRHNFVVISLKQAERIHGGMVEYEVIKEFDSRIRDDIYRSLEYIFDNAYEKKNIEYYLEKLPYRKSSDYDDEVHEYAKQLYACIRKQDEDAYEDIKNELVDYYFNNQWDYEF